MSYSPILLLHIASGTLGMLSGFVAVSLRKGSRRHGLAGDVFVISMMSLAATGVYLAALKHQPGNIPVSYTHLCGPAWREYLENIMEREWNDSQPIYRQIRDRVVAMILDGVLKEGDPLPSVRNVAAEYRVNPLTVLKSYQQLVDEQLVESLSLIHI